MQCTRNISRKQISGSLCQKIGKPSNLKQLFGNKWLLFEADLLC